MTTAIVSTKTTLLKAVRKGDFAALLALADYYGEGRDRSDTQLQEKIVKYLQRAKFHANHASIAPRMGRAESMRRWTRDLFKELNRVEKVWLIPRRTGWRDAPHFYDVCMTLARAAITHYKVPETD